MTSILTRYLMRSILTSSALVLVVLLALAALFEFIAELDDVRNDYRTPQVLLFTLLRLPNLAFEMMPVAVLIGSLLGLGALASHSEIIVMRAAGYSVRRMAGMVALSGLVLLVLAALLGEFVGPPLDFYARDMRAKARYGEEDDRVADATWVRDGSVFLHLERLSPEFEFGAVYLYRFNDDRSLASIARADDSGIRPDDSWRLENVRETRFADDGVHVVETNLAVENFGVNVELLGNTLAKPLSLSLRGLRGYIDYLDRNQLDSRQDRAEFWYRISRTVTVLVMPILSLGFVFGSLRSGSTGGRLVMGVVIGLTYYIASEVLANSGQVFDLDPVVVSWLPAVALVAVTAIALARIR
jgi:lipopolysaccharide export system permease protein